MSINLDQLQRQITMKDIDVSTSKIVAEWTNTSHIGDCGIEELHCTPGGKFFILAKDGPSRTYSTIQGYIYGSGINPISEGAAREWVLRHSRDSYEDIFGEAEE